MLEPTTEGYIEESKKFFIHGELIIKEAAKSVEWEAKSIGKNVDPATKELSQWLIESFEVLNERKCTVCRIAHPMSVDRSHEELDAQLVFNP